MANVKGKDKNSIENVASAVFDNGRRGNPRPGCDCEQCFGYCLVDADEAYRESLTKGPARSYPLFGELDFDV